MIMLDSRAGIDSYFNGMLWTSGRDVGNISIRLRPNKHMPEAVMSHAARLLGRSVLSSRGPASIYQKGVLL